MRFKAKFKNSLKNFQNIKVLTAGALLVALYVLSATFLHFYPSESVKISISFIFVVIAAYLYGPVMAMIVGGMGDLLQWVIHPHGALIIGITIAVAFSGLIFGIFLYNEKVSLPRIILACTAESALIEALFKSLVLSQTYGISFTAQLLLRLVSVAVMLIVMILLSYIVLKATPIQKQLKKLR